MQYLSQVCFYMHAPIHQKPQMPLQFHLVENMRGTDKECEANK